MKHAFSKMQVGDITINYELIDYTAPWRTDEPETFLLYHGYARNLKFWEQWMPRLASDYRVLRFDARGCGASSAPPAGSTMTFDQLVGDSLGLMDKLGIKRAHWVGESSGGIVGLAFALAHPARLHTLTVCDTPFKRSAHIAATYTLGETDRAAAFAKYGVGGWCRKTLPYRIDTTKASPELCEWYIAQMDATPVHVAIEKEKMVGRSDFWPHLPHIKVPTLILAGRKSALAEEDKMQAMQKQMPQARLVTFEGYGHGINLLAPDRCVSEIRDFLAALQNA
jgi:pimeloyl-ACP methyl ester carboxylesterase